MRTVKRLCRVVMWAVLALIVVWEWFLTIASEPNVNRVLLGGALVGVWGGIGYAIDRRFRDPKPPAATLLQEGRPRRFDWINFSLMWFIILLVWYLSIDHPFAALNMIAVISIAAVWPVLLITRWILLGWLDGGLHSGVTKVCSSLLIAQLAHLAVKASPRHSDFCSNFFEVLGSFWVLFLPTFTAAALIWRTSLAGPRIERLINRLAAGFPWFGSARLADRLLGAALGATGALALVTIITRTVVGPDVWWHRLQNSVTASVPVPSSLRPALGGEPLFIEGGRETALQAGLENPLPFCLDAPTPQLTEVWGLALIALILLGPLAFMVAFDPLLYMRTAKPQGMADCPECAGAGIYGSRRTRPRGVRVRGHVLAGILCRRCNGTGSPAAGASMPRNPRSVRLSFALWSRGWHVFAAVFLVLAWVGMVMGR